jgi:GGDEF domain-containing protein
MDEKTLIKEIKTLQKAAKIHANYSISQYKKVLKYLEKIENEKKLLEEKVKERTQHLEKEMEQKTFIAQKLAHLAKYDQLTGLANRYMFLEELELTKKESSLLNTSFAILFIDLDGFKLINDTYGHEIGDEVLKEVAKRIRSIVRKNDLVSRLGGDEFTVILKSIEKEEAA